MIARYTRPEMAAIWSEENKYRVWLQVELAVCQAHHALGQIPADALRTIQEKADFSASQIAAIEAEVKHDVIAFLTNVAEYVGPDSRYIHMGMTSSDLLDTTLALLLRQSGNIIRQELQRFREILAQKAREYKFTACVGRSHGVHAEPTSFGLKFALWYDEACRNLVRLENAISAVSIGKISGAVGNYAFINPRIEELVCEELGLRPAPIATQVIQRDVHAEFVNSLALIGCMLEKIAVEIRHLQRTEVLEAEEPFTKGQKGSSAMPHKRNPIGTENITGLARLLRAHSGAAMEDVALWHERDISHSSVERVILPDSSLLTDYALHRLGNILQNLVVYPENMVRNLILTQGLIFSQALLLELVEKGLTREEAYQLVQESATRCWRESKSFQEVIQNDPRMSSILSQQEILACFDTDRGMRNVEYIFKKLGL